MIVIELQPVAQDSVFVHKGLLCVVKYTCRGMYMAISADVIKQHFTTMPLWRRAMAIGAPAVVAAGACLLPTVLAESPTLSVCSPPEAVNGHASSTQEQPKTIQGAERSFAMKLGLFINDLNFYGVRAVISDQNAQTPHDEIYTDSIGGTAYEAAEALFEVVSTEGGEVFVIDTPVHLQNSDFCSLPGGGIVVGPRMAQIEKDMKAAEVDWMSQGSTQDPSQPSFYPPQVA